MRSDQTPTPENARTASIINSLSPCKLSGRPTCEYVAPFYRHWYMQSKSIFESVHGMYLTNVTPLPSSGDERSVPPGHGSEASICFYGRA